ncbi:MAG: ammonium transporter [Phreatobacter sp.]|uniref:ammonium transporter n=1 Tax=Phreatobacter sp. TaxID=1966341 RepID=UPI001A484C51|nr:ammonium transporter [Phreatobacter sp.]MBL8570979.1 ammonium transporter [Phreatobacter sp.]
MSPRSAWAARVACGLLLVCLAQAARAQQAASTIDAGHTAWMLGSTALVLLMTIPGLALFYAGMVRKKNVLATMMQSFAATGIVSVLWFAGAYSLAFTGDGAWLGGLGRVFLSGLTRDGTNALAPTIPESVFLAYQMTFAIITCALIAGAVADRMKFSAFIAFIVAWLFVVYVPIAHWVWGGGFLAAAGLLDYAGGTVVHINAGVAGLVAAVLLGRRRGFGQENLAPYDLSMAVVGTGLLWVGWFGFNAGSALAADGRAGLAMLATHFAASAGALSWMAIEWWSRGKPSVLGIISGAVAGLGTVTPASGFILPAHGIVIGLAAGALCYWACTSLKRRLRYDDSLDVFGVHGVGGILGTLAAGIFAAGAVTATADNPAGLPGLLEGNPRQLLIQLGGVLATIAWSGVGSFVLLKLIDAAIGLRVTDEAERDGLDLALHGEAMQ